ncbi:MAG: tetratricopeptide repeat protein, partial [Candidatus Limnocylindria bacterium]
EKGGRAVEFETRKAVAILAYLALEGGTQPRDRLAAMLWPDADEERARASLRRTLSPLRTELGDDVLVADTVSVRLGTDAVATDVDRFRSLLHEGKLGEAVALYRDDLLAGFSLKDSPQFDEWQAARSEDLRGELRAALTRLSAEAAGSGDFRGAVLQMRRLLEIDPLDELAHRELMRIYAQSGDRAAAMRQYRECARVLDSELGVAPMLETKDLYERIRSGEGGDTEPARRSADEAAGDVYTLHGSYAKAIASYEAAASEAAPAARAQIEHKLAEVHHRRGDWERAEQHYKRAAEGGDDAHKARVTADWSLAAHRHGDASRALTLARKALALSEAAGEVRALAEAHNILGILRRDRRHLEQALELARALPDPSVRVAALNNLAVAYRRAGELDRAMSYAREALEQSEALGDRHREAALHNNLADVLQALGRRDEAMRHLKRAVALFSEIGGAREPEVWKLVEW